MRLSVRVFYLSIIIISISSACLLFTPYGGDDIINHNSWPNLGFAGAISFAVELAQIWFMGQGRLFPVATLWMASVFYFFQNIFAYKLFLLLLVAVQITLQYRWMRGLSLGDRFRDSAVPVACIGCAIWSGWWPAVFNPFNSFHGMFILSGCIGLMLHLLWLSEGIDANRKTMIASAMTLFMLCLYELNIIFVLSLLGLPRGASCDKRLPSRAKLLALGSLVYLLIVRAAFKFVSAATPAPKYTFSISSFGLRAFAKQFLAPFLLPFQNFFSIPGSTGLLLLVLSAALLGSWAYWQKRAPSTMTEYTLSRFRYPALLSALLLVVPPILFASQSYWQVAYLNEGVYLYIYYQLLGLSILLYCVHQLIASRLSRFRVVATAFIFAAFMATASVNIAATQSLLPGDHTVKPAAACKNLPWQC